MLAQLRNLTSFRTAALVAASLLLAAAFFAAPRAFAGTTGQLSGVAVDAATQAPIAGAKITANSPSALETTTTDKGGHFTFASLPPDTYSVTLEAPGYTAATVDGIGVVSDNLLTITVSANASAAH
jgi:hypothetical protein